MVKVLLSADRVTNHEDLQEKVPFTSTYFSQLSSGPYPYTQFQSLALAGAFQCSLPLSDEENFKFGGNLTDDFLNLNFLNPDGNVGSNQEGQKIGTQLGIGLESPKDYTMGLQWKSVSLLPGAGSINDPGASSGSSTGNYDLYQLAFGGEKWLEAVWAFRMGLVLEEDVYKEISQSTFSTTINVGWGLEKALEGRISVFSWVYHGT